MIGQQTGTQFSQFRPEGAKCGCRHQIGKCSGCRTGASLGAWTDDGSPSPAQLANRLVNLYGHTAPAAIADARADRIVTVSADGTARIHLLRAEELIRRARTLLNRELTCDERVRYLNEALNCPAPTQ